MNEQNEITVDAGRYSDYDDCLEAAALDYAEDHDLEGWQVSARWVDDSNRDQIVLTVPADEQAQVG